jgi:hypothetical protein
MRVPNFDSTPAKSTYEAKAVPMFQNPRDGIPDARSESTHTMTQTTTIAIPKAKLPNHAANEIGRK